MTKKCFVCSLLAFLALFASCNHHDVLNTSTTSLVTATEKTDTTSTYRDFEAEREKSTFDIEYPQFSEYNEKINQIIKEAASPLLDDFPDAGKFNVDCVVRYEVKLQSNKTISIAFIGTKYWRGAAHPIHVYHTINVDLQTSKKISLSDVIDLSKENVLVLLQCYKTDQIPDGLYTEVIDRYLKDKDGLQLIIDMDSEQLTNGAYSYFTEEHLVIRLPWYDKHIEITVPWDKVQAMGIIYTPL